MRMEQANSGLSFNDDTLLNLRAICAIHWSREMKRLLLGAAIAALSSQAFGQVHEIPRTQIISGSGDEIHADFVTEPDETGEIIAIGQRIGTTQVAKLTSPVSVMTSEDIAARGQQYISELLRSLPGIAVNTSGPGGGLTQIRLRGSEANHVLVLIDGVEVANPNAGEFDFSGLRAQDVERIEVLRGEQSALYGSDAIGGVINIITRAGATREGWRASVEAGSRDTLEGQISAVLPLGEAYLSLNGNAFTTEGYDISGLGGEKDGSKSRSLNIGLNKVEIGGVTLSAKYGTSNLDVDFDQQINGRLSDTSDDNTSRQRNTYRLDARFDFAEFEHLITGSISEEKIDTVATATVFDFSTFLSAIARDVNGNILTTRSLSKGERENLNWAAKRQFGDVSVTFLGETEKETYKLPLAEIDVDNRNKALAADVRYTQDALSLTGSLRQDFNDRFDDAATWRLGAGYTFEDFGGRIRGSVGTGVKNPSLIELFGFTPGSGFQGNPDLKPETSFGYSLGYEHKWDQLTVSIDYFNSELEDEIFTDFAFDPNTGFFIASPGNREFDSKREGVELEARWQIKDDFSVRGSATFLETEENNVDEIRRPDFLASATVTWDATDRLSLTTNIDHNGEQLDTDFATFQNVTLDAFTLVGARASYDLTDNVTLSLRGENLLDEDYQEVVGYASLGRAVYGGLNLNF